MENTENEKSAEQIASENNLNLAITDEVKTDESTATDESANNEGVDAQTAIKTALSIIPMGCAFAGLQNTAAVWSDDVLNNVSSALIPVLNKYAFGQKMLAFLQTGGGVAEGVLIMALYPVAIASIDAYQLDVALREKEVNEVTEHDTSNE